MFAKYQVYSDRIVLEYYDSNGNFAGGERVDLKRQMNAEEIQTLAYYKAAVRAFHHGVQLQCLSKIEDKK